MTRIRFGLLGLLLVAAATFFTGAPASAADAPCVPSEASTEVIEHPAVTHTVHHDAVTHVVHHPAVTETIVQHAAYDETVIDEPERFETVIDVPAGWQRYSWTGHSTDTAPNFPAPGWQPNVKGDPHGVGVEGPYFRDNSNGRGDWFYLERTPEVNHVVLIPAVTHVVHHPAVTQEVEISPARDEVVVDEAAYDETVVDSEAYTETIEHPAVTCPPVDKPEPPVAEEPPVVIVINEPPVAELAPVAKTLPNTGGPNAFYAGLGFLLLVGGGLVLRAGSRKA